MAAGGSAVDDEVRVRRATDDDLDAAIALAATSLGWDPARPNPEFFRWKHLENPFGASPMWLAEVGGRLAGFRTFLRWRFLRPDGTVARAVRAVDTATHPDFQGRGIFTTLTLRAIEELRAEGVDFIFNTPNAKSRPGYLKMGWGEVGRVPVRVRPSVAPAAVLRLAKARVPAEKWSEASNGGVGAHEVLAEHDAVAALLRSLAPPDGYRTDRSADYLDWRYRFAPLHYRAVVAPGGVEHGLCVFRVHGRGAASEVTVTELLVPAEADRTARELLGAVRAAAGGDYLMWAGGSLPRGTGFWPLPNQGPTLTWRAINQTEQPPLEDWRLTMGDIELF